MIGFDGNRLGFEPPSDFVAEPSSGSGRGNVFKIVGIGCAVVVLLVGLVTAVGIFKGVSCCKDFGATTMNTVGASAYSVQIGEQLRSGELDAVHEELTPTLKQTLSPEQLAGMFDQPWLAESVVFSGSPGLMKDNVEVESLDDLKDMSTWRMPLRFLPRSWPAAARGGAGRQDDQAGGGRASWRVRDLRADG